MKHVPLLAAIVVLVVVVAVVVERGVAGTGGYVVLASDDAYVALDRARAWATVGPSFPAGVQALQVATLAWLFLLFGPFEAAIGVVGICAAIGALVVLDRLVWRGLPAVERGVGLVLVAALLAPACVQGVGVPVVVLPMLLMFWAATDRFTGRTNIVVLGATAAAVGSCTPALGLGLAAGLGLGRRWVSAGVVGGATVVGTGAMLAWGAASGWPAAAVWTGAIPLPDLDPVWLPALVTVACALGVAALAGEVIGGLTLGVAALAQQLVGEVGVPLVVIAVAVVMPQVGRRGAALVGVLVVGGVALAVQVAVGFGAIAAQGRMWRGPGQVARLLTEEQPGIAGVFPAGLVSWRAPEAPIVDLSCRGSIAAARACLEPDWDSRLPRTWPSLERAAVVGTPGFYRDALGPAVAVWAGDQRVTWHARGGADQLTAALGANEWRLADGLALVGPSGAVAIEVPDSACPDRVVFDARGADLVTSDGKVFGGSMVAARRDLRIPADLRPGVYRLAVWASSTEVDGSSAILSVRAGGVPVARLEVAGGPARRVAVDFEVGAPADSIQLVFVNDAYDAVSGADRNVALASLRLERLHAPSEARQRALRERLGGANLVLVSIDTLRADHLGAYGYARDTSPSMDALAARGTVFRNAVSASHWTAPSHATLLTGLHPPEHGVQSYPIAERLGEEATTLAEVFHAAGYRTGGFAEGLYVGEAVGLSQGFDKWAESGQSAAVRFQEAAHWVDELGDDEPFFLFVHTYEVHEPYDPPAPYDRRYADPAFVEDEARILRRPWSETVFAGRLPSPAELAFQVALYDGGIRYTDDSLRFLLDAIDRSAGETLIVVTSDHGEEFFEHGSAGHGQLYAEHLRVPLILAHPALEQLAEPEVVQIAPAVDLFPTLVDLLGVTGPTDLPGRSLVPALTGACDADATAWSSSIQTRPDRSSILDLSGHYIRDGYERFFRVAEDRAERRDIAGEAPEVGAYRDRASAWSTELVPRVVSQAGTLDEEQRAALRALGYLE